MGIPVQNLHIGMQVRHPRYGVGTVKALTEHTADITFDDAPRTVDPAMSDLTVAEPTASLTEMQMPLSALIRETAQAMVEALGLEKPDQLVEGLGGPLAARHGSLLPAGRCLAAGEGSAVGNVFSQDRDDSQQPARPRTEGECATRN